MVYSTLFVSEKSYIFFYTNSHNGTSESRSSRFLFSFYSNKGCSLDMAEKKHVVCSSMHIA